MDPIESIAVLRRARAALSGSVGFVPTMGALHRGHLELVRRAAAEQQHVVVSIFVNPTQFAAGEDIARYPRDLARDLAALADERVSLVFAPQVAEMYPAGATTRIDVGPLATRLEGAHRPGHFIGVATVVAKLCHIVAPDALYLGQKDVQQTLVIRRMARDLDLPVQVIVCPTVREPDGLALSSRNAYLSPAERALAPELFAALAAAAQRFAAGERRADALRGLIRRHLAASPAIAVDYVSVADPVELHELDGLVAHAVVSLAATIGRTRLIDNIVLGAP
ncbi:MAG: pantoate--beta-alanine ligase [Chloroflexi bacterium]|nr:pantoate--beta-alanine ligase [Chloroflexota bacterium]